MKKLLALIAVFGLTVSSWGLAPAPETGAQEPAAQFGYTIARVMADANGWDKGGFWYGFGQAASIGFFGGVGAFVGSSLGPAGTAIGAGLGGA